MLYRIALNIGPNRLNPSIAMGIRTELLLLRRFPIIASPGIGGETLHLMVRLSFDLSES